jgi:hypothetical protein
MQAIEVQIAPRMTDIGSIVQHSMKLLARKRNGFRDLPRKVQYAAQSVETGLRATHGGISIGP